jgi:hypothetical protein
MTAISDAMKHAGGPGQREVELNIAIAKWANAGGTLERLIAIAQAAYSGAGHVVDDAQKWNARPDLIKGAGQISGDAQAIDASAARGSTAIAGMPKGQPFLAVSVRQHSRSLPTHREPTAGEVAAAGKVRKTVAHGFWDRTIGGELRLRSSTKADWINFARKFHIGEHICNRMVTEIAWPDDDKTPLEKVANEKQVKDILESGPRALRLMEGAHA